jgi:hypothetical protein
LTLIIVIRSRFLESKKIDKLFNVWKREVMMISLVVGNYRQRAFLHFIYFGILPNETVRLTAWVLLF